MTGPAERSPGAEGSCRGHGGLALCYRGWEAGAPRAALLVAPGLGEHSGRYARLAAELVPAGVSVFALDHRGHGRSEGARGHVPRFDVFLEDLEAFRREVATRLGGELPTFLLGHSLGGLIVIRYLEEHPEAPLRGAILSAPALGVAVRVPRWKTAAAKLLSRVAPALPLGSEIDPAGLSRDPEVVREYRADPLVHSRITPRLYTEMSRAMQRARRERSRIRVPSLLFLIPERDSIVRSRDAFEFADGLPGDVAVHRYPEHRHEPLNELGREEVIDDLRRWLADRHG